MATKITRTITTPFVNVAYVDVAENGKLAMREDSVVLDGEFEDYGKLEKAVRKVRSDAKILKDSTLCNEHRGLHRRRRAYII